MTNVGTIRTTGAAAAPPAVPEARAADEVEPFDPTPSTGGLVVSMGFSAFVGVQFGAVAGMLAAKALGGTGALKAALMVTGGVAGATAGAMFGRHMEHRGRMERHQRHVEAIRGPSLQDAAKRIFDAHEISPKGSISTIRREGGFMTGMLHQADTVAFEEVGSGTRTLRAFDRHDLLAAAEANGDGRVSMRELTEFLTTFDADHDGRLGKAEGRAVLDRHPTEGALIAKDGLTPLASYDADDDDLANLAER